MKTNTPASTDPYLNGRKAWNEQFGTYIAAARAWRWTAIVSLLLAAVCAGGLIWFAGQPRLIPYLVEIDEQGQPAQVMAAKRMQNPEAERNVLRFQLGQFVKGVRSVSPDVTLQRDAIQQVYALLRRNDPAYQTVGEWYRDNHPLELAKDATVAVKIHHILPVSEKSWRVEWQEYKRARNGALLSDVAMTGTVTVIQGGEVSEANLLRNPTGLYITHFDWQRQLSQSH